MRYHRHRLPISSPRRRTSWPQAPQAQLQSPAIPRLARSLALALCLLVAAWACAAAPAHGAPAALARHAASTVAGVVVNGTRGGTPVAGQQVTLRATGGSGTRDLATATTDAAGRFDFANAANAAGGVLAVYARFQGGFYSSGAISPDGDAARQVVLTVYDATTSDAALRVTSATILVRDPKPKNGLIAVGEFFTFHNAGNTAFVGAPAPANGMPMGLLRFALPPGATNLTLGKGFAGAEAAQVPAGFGANATVPPGDWEFAFAFDAPYTGTRFALPVKAEYPTDAALLLVAPTMAVDATDFADRGQKTLDGEQYRLYTREALAPGAEIQARFGNLPRAGEPPTFDFGQLVALGGALALLLTLLAALYLRRGDLAIALRLVPAPALAGKDEPARDLTPEGREAERARLLRALLRLERDRAAGRLAAAQFRARSGQARAALRALLAQASPEELARMAADAVDAAAPVGRDGDGTQEAHPGAPRSEAGEVASRTLSGGGR